MKFLYIVYFSICMLVGGKRGERNNTRVSVVACVRGAGVAGAG